MPHLTTESRTSSRDRRIARTQRSPRKLGLIPLVCVMYLVVSGGAYGLEDAVRMAGPRLTLLLCLVVPLTLSLPTALMAAELTALMPVEGGFYFWVKEALGPFAGFAEAYLTILYTAVDMAIYPVLFASYLSFILPLGPAAQIAIGIALVWAAGGLNFLGVRPVGMASIVLAAILVSPFAILVIVGIPRLIHFTMPTPPLFGADPWGALGCRTDGRHLEFQRMGKPERRVRGNRKSAAQLSARRS